MALETEKATFNRELQELLTSHRGQFVVVHGDNVHGFWPTKQAAIEAGYERFDLEPFLVKEITDSETPQFFARGVRPCPT